MTSTRSKVIHLYKNPRKKSVGRRSKADRAVAKKEKEAKASPTQLEELKDVIETAIQPKDSKEELDIKEAEHNELFLKFSNLNSLYKKKKFSKWEDQCWFKYVNQSREINPLILPEVNAYLTELDEDSTYDIMHVFEECRKSQQMCENIKLALLDCPEIAPKTMRSWMESIKNLQFMLRKKIEIATFLILRACNEHINDESFNMEFGVTDQSDQSKSFSLCLWGNISKNLRHRGMDLPSIGFSFELPPELMKINCAVRILHTQFDNITPLFCESALLGERKLGELTVTDNLGKFMLEEIYPASDDQVSPLVEASEFAEMMTSILKQIGSPEIFGKGEAEKITPGMTFTPPEEPELTIVDNREYFLVGGLYHFDLFQLPYQIVKSRCWIFTNWDEKMLNRIPYKTSIIPIRHPKPDMSPAVAAEFADSEIKRFDREMCSAVSVSLKLPDNVLFLEQPVPAFWIPSKKGFTMIGFFETKHDEVLGDDLWQPAQFSNAHHHRNAGGLADTDW